MCVDVVLPLALQVAVVAAIRLLVRVADKVLVEQRAPLKTLVADRTFRAVSLGFLHRDWFSSALVLRPPVVLTKVVLPKGHGAVATRKGPLSGVHYDDVGCDVYERLLANGAVRLAASRMKTGQVRPQFFRLRGANRTRLHGIWSIFGWVCDAVAHVHVHDMGIDVRG